MKKKICLVTWAYSVNYGTCLQCYALSRFLGDLGYSVYIPTGFKYYYGINRPIHTILRIKDVIFEKIVNKDSTECLSDEKKSRLGLNKRFVEEAGKLISFKSHREFDKFMEGMDIL